MLIPSPTQATAVRAWLLDSLNRDDLGVLFATPPFSEQTVNWGGRDHPRPDLYASLFGVSLVGYGIARSYSPDDIDTPTVVTERRQEQREWAVSITIASKLDPQAPSLADAASVHLQRAVGSFEGEAMLGTQAVGVAPLRRDAVVNVARLQGSTEWETRASVVLTFGCGWFAERSVDWVERATGTGTVPPLGPLGFDSDNGAP